MTEIIIKTRNDNFHNSSKKEIFLGFWSLPEKFLFQSKYKSLEILDFRWDDRNQLAMDAEYLRSFYHDTLGTLSDQFNDIHGTDYSTRFWEICAGPFLLHAIHALYDRFVSIQTAFNSYPNSVTATYNESFCPVNLSHWFQSLIGDDFNSYLYTEVVNYLDPDRGTPIDYKLQETDFSVSINYKDVIKVVTSRLSKHWNKILIQRSNSHLTAVETYDLCLKLGQFPSIEPNFLPSTLKFSAEIRGSQLTKFVKPQSDFEDFFYKTIWKIIPMVLVESFQELMDQVKANSPKKVTNTLMSNAFCNEYFSCATAFAVENGSTLTVSQHGGFYGTTRYSFPEEHELSICDNYLSWGWEGDPSVHPFYINKSFEFGEYKSDGNILVGLFSCIRYVYRLDSWVQGSQMFFAGESQIKFIESLSKNVKKQTILRFYREFGWQEKSRISSIFPNVSVENMADRSFHESVSKSKLFVGTYNTTMLLECMSANFPCLFFWNPEHEEIREDAKPYYDLLHEAKILFYCPKKCAEFVNTIASDVMAWWNLEKTQSAVTKFCSKYAVKSENLVSELADFLKSHQS